MVVCGLVVSCEPFCYAAGGLWDITSEYICNILVIHVIYGEQGKFYTFSSDIPERNMYANRTILYFCVYQHKSLRRVNLPPESLCVIYNFRLSVPDGLYIAQVLDDIFRLV